MSKRISIIYGKGKPLKPREGEEPIDYVSANPYYSRFAHFAADIPDALDPAYASGPVRCVSRGDFTEEEIQNMEALYGAPIKRPVC